MLKTYTLLLTALVIVGGTADAWSEESVAPSESSAPTELQPGHFEVAFKNGKTVRGEILSVEGDRLRFKPYDGPSFTLATHVIAQLKPLGGAATFRDKSRALTEKGDFNGAIKLLQENVEEYPDLADDLVHLMSIVKDLRREAAREEFEAYRKTYESALDREQHREASILAQEALDLFPGFDQEALGDIVLAEFLMHRRDSKPARSFKSEYVEELRQLDPNAPVIRGIEAEMGLSSSLHTNWKREREIFLKNALTDAGKLYEAGLYAEAKDVLDRALGFGPEEELRTALESLALRVNRSYRTEIAEERATERERVARLKEKYGEAGSATGSAGNLSDKQYERTMARIKDRKAVAKRRR